MKKFIALVLIIICLLFLKSPFSFSNLSASYDGIYTFYSLENFEDEDVTSLKSGNGFLLSCDNEKAEEVYAKLSKNLIQGESFTFSGNKNDAEKILSKLSANVLKTEEVDNIFITYANSPNINKSIEVDGQTINIQIAINGNKVTVGTPLILGGY